MSWAEYWLMMFVFFAILTLLLWVGVGIIMYLRYIYEVPWPKDKRLDQYRGEKVPDTLKRMRKDL